MGYQWKGTHQGPDMFDATEPRKHEPTPATPTRELQPCGTSAAYFRHRRKNETPCDECRTAQAEYMAERRRGKGPRGNQIGNPRVAACGTDSGTKRHYANGEPACQECRAASNEYRRQWKEARRAA